MGEENEAAPTCSHRATMWRDEILVGPSTQTDLEAIVIGVLEIARHAVVVNETP